MTIKVLLLLFALVAVTVKAYAYDAPCYEPGITREYRAIGDCDVVRITPVVFKCGRVSNLAPDLEWIPTHKSGTPFFVVSIQREELAYFYEQSLAEDFAISECAFGAL